MNNSQLRVKILSIPIDWSTKQNTACDFLYSLLREQKDNYKTHSKEEKKMISFRHIVKCSFPSWKLKVSVLSVDWQKINKKYQSKLCSKINTSPKIISCCQFIFRKVRNSVNTYSLKTIELWYLINNEDSKNYYNLDFFFSHSGAIEIDTNAF